MSDYQSLNYMSQLDRQRLSLERIFDHAWHYTLLAPSDTEVQHRSPIPKKNS